MPRSRQAITLWPDQDEAFSEIASKIGELVEKLIEKRKQLQKYEQIARETIGVECVITNQVKTILVDHQDRLKLTDLEVNKINESIFQENTNKKNRNKEVYRKKILSTIEENGKIIPQNRFVLEKARKSLQLTKQEASIIEKEARKDLLPEEQLHVFHYLASYWSSQSSWMWIAGLFSCSFISFLGVVGVTRLLNPRKPIQPPLRTELQLPEQNEKGN